ncbi:MAG: alpha/beta fold hydrolase [Butyricicoccaceae bacterium]
MEFTRNIFPSACGTVSISYYILRPTSVPARAIVQISHGVNEYFLRYTQFAKYLCSLGFIVCGHDHIGHGESVQTSGGYGFFGQKDGCRVLVEDIHTLNQIVHERWPELPCYLFGHSMGAMLSRIYLAKYGDTVDGCILSGVPAQNAVAPIGVRVASSVIRSRGPMYRSVTLDRMVFGRYNDHIKDCRTKFDWLTRDEGIVNLYESDAKCNYILTASGFRDLFRINQMCNGFRLIRETSPRIPILFIAGDADPVGDFGTGVRRIASAYKGAGFSDIDMILYKDCRHEVLNELGHEQVYGDISRWLEQHIRQRAEKKQEALSS